MVEGTAFNGPPDTSHQSELIVPINVNRERRNNSTSQQCQDRTSDDSRVPEDSESNSSSSYERKDKNLDAPEITENARINDLKTNTRPSIIYKIEYTNIDTNEVVFARVGDKPLQVQDARDSGETPVLEVITNIRTFWNPRDDSRNGKQPTDSQPPTAHSSPMASVKISSPAILNALPMIIDYYPGLSYFGEPITIPEPYAVLVHHEKELAKYRERFAPDVELLEEEKCERKAKTYDDLGVLATFLQDTVGASVQAERQRHARGVCTFEMLWMLYKPGTDVYHDPFNSGKPNGYVVFGIEGGMHEKRATPWWVTMWYLKYNGWVMGRVTRAASQLPFDGERRISELNTYPCEYLVEDAEAKDFKPHRTRLEERGRMYWRLRERQCMNHNGYTISIPKLHIVGLIMIDTETFYSKFRPQDRPDMGKCSDVGVLGVTDCLCSICRKFKSHGAQTSKSKFSDYNVIYPSSTKELTHHMYFLCDDQVMAHHMKSRSWEHMDLYCISEPIFDESMIDTLVMPDERRNLIKALAQPYRQKGDPNNPSTFKPWTADFVAGKGEGKIFLLHGRPGVGKTYTAECIAEYTKRPLLSLTMSDIGIKPIDAEDNLVDYFERARLWDAILLIDEADVFMERRETQDLNRNSLVSGFLRAMETCQSILFLTTNRVGSFDDAFISRIHISLYYPDFSEADRKKVWWNFFEKLAKERGDVMRVPIDTKDYTQGQEVRAVKWNGREIRNAFQTAVALAEYGNEKDEDGKILLKDKHIMQIVHMSEEFKAYLKTLHLGDESKRAERQRIRLDEYDPNSSESHDQVRRGQR